MTRPGFTPRKECPTHGTPPDEWGCKECRRESLRRASARHREAVQFERLLLGAKAPAPRPRRRPSRPVLPVYHPRKRGR